VGWIELIALAVGGVQIAVGSQPLVNLAAQQFVHRLLDCLADDVPARHLQAADHAHQGQVGPQREPRAIAFAPDRFDLEGILGQETPRKHILDHRGNHAGPEGRGVHLAHSLDAAGGLELQKHEIAAAETRRRIAHHEYFHAVQFH
jgi:hypothetical protein